MTDTNYEKFKALLAEIAELRDETKLKIHLGSKDLQDDWHELEEKRKKLQDKWTAFSKEAELAKSGQDIKSAFGIIGEELKDAYKRIKSAL